MRALQKSMIGPGLEVGKRSCTCACRAQVPARRHISCSISGARLTSTRCKRRLRLRPKATNTDSDTDQYEGQADTSFAKDYMNPDAKQSDPSDMKYEHPADLERPQFHPMAQRGFVSDPCGPLYDPKHRRYHLFMQNVSDSIEWKFGITWCHVSSTDLVHWQHHPPALEPGKISPKEEGYYRWDADGCFTGCATIAPDGRPTILYTGVRLRNNKKAGPFPEPEDDTEMPFFEAQLNAAHADPEDEFLEVWSKKEVATLAEFPPAELRPSNEHTGWRDPFLFETPTPENDMMYSMLVGNGSEKTGGRVLVYRSKDLTSGWEFTGTLCGTSSTDHGCLWEYPNLVKLPQAERKEDGTVAFEYKDQEVGVASEAARDHVLLFGEDAPVNPCIYYVSTYDAKSQKFDLENGKGPYRFDMGEILYASNSLKCPEGRHVIWGWLQEGERDDHGYSYSGCQSLPREIMLSDDRIVQRPILEVEALREDRIQHEEKNREVQEGKLLGLPKDAGNALEIMVTFRKGSAKQSGILIGSWAKGGRGTCALLYDWDRNYLEAIFDTFFVCPRTAEIRKTPFGEPSEKLERRTVGGPLHPAIVGDSIKLRAFLDGSCLEVFTDTGAALTTRVYRGMRPKGAPADIGFMATNGSCEISEVDVWQMADCWIDADDFKASGKEPCKKSKLTSATNITDNSEYGEGVGRCLACRGLHKKGECPIFRDGYHPGEEKD